jgi:hypothetical protein
MHYLTGMTRRIRLSAPAAAAALLTACGAGADERPSAEDVAVDTEVLASLDDGARPVLARPLSVTRLSDGGYALADRSDRDMKLYGRDGRRRGQLGRAGRGPGEFSALTSGGVFRDTLFGFDMVPGRLYLFAPGGAVARALTVPQGTWSATAVDDSLFLLIRSVAPARRHALLLMRPDGTLRSSFFDASRFVANNPDLAQTAAIVADARAGTVFAGVFGGDSLYAFDYEGRMTGSAPVDAVDPLPSFRSLAAANGGRLRRQGGGWVVDGAEVLIALLALNGSRAVLHVQRFDAETGLDPVEGGRLLLFDLNGRGVPRPRGRAAIPAGLMGRDADGYPLLLGYAPGSLDRYVVQRLAWAPTPGWGPP